MLNFASNTRGNVALVFSLLAFPLLLGIGLAIDYTTMVSKQNEFQNRADAAALAGAKLIALGGAAKSEIIAGTETFALSAAGSDSNIVVKAEMPDNGSISVTVSEAWVPVFAHLVSSKVTPIVAQATAQAAGNTRICVLALSQTMSSSVSLTGAAQITANGCGVYSNSTDRYAITSYKDSILQAAMICSSGGTSDNTKNFIPAPITDCPPISDPLSSWPAPTFGACDFNNMMINSGNYMLNPGVYCGGLLITGSAKATLRPGIYVIKDGPLTVAKTASMSGEHVGFYLTGEKSIFLFANTSFVELAAPKDGALAGLLFFEDRNSPPDRYFEIVSENARRLVGTIYLPKGNLRVSSKKPVADLSDYTAIVANSVQLNHYPSLVLNTNYHTTDVPVPAGLANSSSSLRLAR